MGDSSCESEEKYEIYETGSDMLCVIDLDNSKQTSTKSSVTKPRYRQSYREAWESMRDFKGVLYKLFLHQDIASNCLQKEIFFRLAY